MSTDPKSLISDWNNDPPPSGPFLEAEANYVEACKDGGWKPRADAYDKMIEAISTRQDLAQFLLRSRDDPGEVRADPTFNESTSDYWDGLAGVISGASELDDADPSRVWRLWAKILVKATCYE